MVQVGFPWFQVGFMVFKVSRLGFQYFFVFSTLSKCGAPDDDRGIIIVRLRFPPEHQFSHYHYQQQGTLLQTETDILEIPTANNLIF